MNIIIFYIFYVFIKFILSQINITEDNYFYGKKFYLEIMNSTFYFSIIQNSFSNELINLLPLENQQLYIENEKILIHLNINIKINISITTTYLNKGNILTDGSNLIIYFGNSTINQYSFLFLGNIEGIDSLIDIIINKVISNINIKLLCENSFINTLEDEHYSDYKYITLSNPSFTLFNRYYYDFYTVPNIYYGNHEPLYKKCKINEDKKYEIICTFSKKEIKRNFDLYKKPPPIYEIIPGCAQKIQSKIFLYFQKHIKNCIEYYEYNKCFKCKNKMYMVSEYDEKCEPTFYFFFLCIIVPIINLIFLISLYIYNCDKSGKKCVPCGEFFYSCKRGCATITVLLLLVSFNVLSFLILY